MSRKRWLSASLLGFCTAALLAQTDVTVLSGSTTSGLGRAPQGSRAFINTVYLITPQEMSASGYGANEVLSVGWRYTASTGQDIATSGNLKVYLQSTADETYTKGTTFDVTGMTKVIDTTVEIPAGAQPFTLTVPAGGVGTQPFNTVEGQGVYVAFEYESVGTLATPLGAPTISCNNSLPNSLGTYQSQEENGTAMGLSAFRPVTFLGVADQVRVLAVYAKGVVNAPRDTLQRVEVLVENLTNAELTVPVHVRVIRLANDSVKFEFLEDVTIPAGGTLLHQTPQYLALAQSVDTIIAEVIAPPGDFINNNSKGYKQLIEYFFAGQGEFLASPPSSIGYGTGAGVILERLYSECDFINGVLFHCRGASSVGNTVRAVIYNAAGVLQTQSTPLVIQESHLGTYQLLTFSFTPGFFDEEIYVGIAMDAAIGGGYFPVGSSPELPLRSDTWYFRSGAFNAASTIQPLPSDFGLRPVILVRYSQTAAAGIFIEGGGVYCLGEQVVLTVKGSVVPPTQPVSWRMGSCSGPTFSTFAQQLVVSPGLGTTTFHASMIGLCSTSFCASTAVTMVPADQDTDEDGIPDCLDSCPLVFGEVGDPCDDGDPNTTDTVLDEDCACVTVGSVGIALRAILEGAYDDVTALMRDDLRAAGLVPLNEPYTALGYTLVNDLSGPIPPSVLQVTGPDAIVDWVLVELRAASDPTVVVASRSALLQRDGDVVDTDGVSPLALQAAPGEHHVLVRHRNHLACMTLGTVMLDVAPLAVDLADPLTATFGTEARKTDGGVALLWAGDVRANGAIRYVGQDNDRDAILLAIGGIVPTAEVFGYMGEDVSMDGVVRYVGFGNDRDRILVNIGSPVLSNIRLEQVP